MRDSCAADGEIYTFGRGGELQLGHDAVMAVGEGSAMQLRLGATQNSYYQPIPTRVSALVFSPLIANNRILRHASHVVYVAPQNGTVVKQVACGRFHSACVAEDGRLYTWGRGASGQLGHGDTNDQATPKEVAGGLKGKVVLKVACGENHSAAIDKTGLIYTTGGLLALGNLGVDPPLIMLFLVT